MSETRRRRALRIGLVLLALPQLAIGVWALASPRGWFDTFPGAGKHWLPLYGGYDEHLVRDVGASFLALGVVLVLAALWLGARLVQAALVAYLAYQLPHAIYHWAADDRLSGTDQALNGASLAATIVLAAALLALSRRPRPRAAPAPGESGGRLGPPPRGLLARVTRRHLRRRFGRELSPLDAYLHHPTLLSGYSALELLVERSHRVDERLKALAEVKAAAVVGCEWCVDFGSWLSRGHGVTEEQLRELPRHRESPAFSALERLVLDYAAAMSRTPAEVDDALFARLREHFDDAQLVELTNAIAIENHRARFNHALGLDAQGFSVGAACAVPERAGTAAV